VPAEQLPRVIGFWGAYVPVGTALAFLGGPLVIAALGWRAWWWLLAAITLAMALLAWRGLAQGSPPSGGDASGSAAWARRLRQTLSTAGPWAVALAFGCYSAQWLAVIGFLPTLYAAAGWSTASVAVASALVAAVNAVGNIGAGQLLHRGVGAGTLLRTGLGALLAFAEPAGVPLPAPLRLLAVIVFSMLGGMVPATLFTLAVRLAPQPGSVGTTVGWVQQLSASGKFAGPPLVAWVASLAGGFRFTGVVTALLACAALLLVQWLLHVESRRLAAL
jgi:MFS transporter, CP family, cyanate transporter